MRQSKAPQSANTANILICSGRDAAVWLWRVTAVIAVCGVMAVGCEPDEEDDGTLSAADAGEDSSTDAGIDSGTDASTDSGTEETSNDAGVGEDAAPPPQEPPEVSPGPSGMRFWLNDQELNGSSVVVVNPSEESQNCLYLENRSKEFIHAGVFLDSFRWALAGTPYSDFLVSQGAEGESAGFSANIPPLSRLSVNLSFDDSHDPHVSSQEGWTDRLSLTSFLATKARVRVRAEANAPISHTPCAMASSDPRNAEAIPNPLRRSVVPDPVLREHPPVDQGNLGAAFYRNYLYVPEGKWGFDIYDASVGSQPVHLKDLAEEDPKFMRSASRAYVHKNHLIVSGSDGSALYTLLKHSPETNGFRLDPQNPRLVDTIEQRLEHVAQNENEIYYATPDTVGRLKIYNDFRAGPNEWYFDVQEKPVLVRDPEVHPEPFTAIAISGDTLLVTTRGRWGERSGENSSRLLQYRLMVGGRGMTAALVSEHDLNLIISSRNALDVVELDRRQFAATKTLHESTHATQLTLFEIHRDAARPLVRAYDYKVEDRPSLPLNSTFAFNDRLALVTFNRILMLELGPDDQLVLNQGLALSTPADSNTALLHYNFIYSGHHPMGVYQLQ